MLASGSTVLNGFLFSQIWSRKWWHEMLRVSQTKTKQTKAHSRPLPHWPPFCLKVWLFWLFWILRYGIPLYVWIALEISDLIWDTPLCMDSSRDIRSDRDTPLSIDSFRDIRSDRDTPLSMDSSRDIRSVWDIPLYL